MRAPSASFATLLLLGSLGATTVAAQPGAMPADDEFLSTGCDGGASEDVVTDESNDHRNIIGTAANPASFYALDDTYLYLRLRVADDPTMASAFVSFGWSWGMDADGDGEFDAFVVLIGQGMSDRIEIIDQDMSDGVTPTVTLTPVGGTMATYATGVVAGTDIAGNGGDWYITVAVELATLATFGIDGTTAIYPSTSSNFTGINEDWACFDGAPGTIGDVPVDPVPIGCGDGDLDDGEECDDGARESGDGCDAECVVEMGFLCTGEPSRCGRDFDGDGVFDAMDVDDDGDGVADDVETGGLFVLGGMAVDPGADADMDGIRNWEDADFWTAIGMPCEDMAPADGRCDTVPASVDPDGDGTPSHLDADADGDGITDVTETGGEDTDGNGRPDACMSVDAMGICAMGALASSPPNADGAADLLADFLDSDSDEDGLPDAIEAFDADGDGSADASAAGVDTDGDGLDDAFDPDCSAASPCGGVEGVVAPLPDADGDGTPNHLQICRDGYVTGMEVCDDGNSVDGDACSNACLLNVGGDCTMGGMCEGGVCDLDLGSCQPCDDTGGAIDEGCSAMASVCVTSMGANTCVVCVDDAAGGIDSGCGAATPACDTSGATPVCVVCGGDADCAGGVCAAGACLACEDSETGDALDRGCAAGAPLCDTSGAAPECVACMDDAASGVDLGCAAGAPVCDASGAPVCVVCADDAMMGIDDGCEAGAPFCNPMGPPTCVACLNDGDCAGTSEICSPAGACVAGCAGDGDCTEPTPSCDVDESVCVECLDDAACDGMTTCGALGTCVFPDSDGDGVPDDVDGDDDGDGLPDADELGIDLSVDSDGDGVPDFQDPDEVSCDDDGNGICEVLAPEVDADGDGIADHLDLDADGDGIADLVEAGGIDVNGDGQVDDFVDANGDGIDDALAAMPLPMVDTDSDGQPNYADADSDGDGITDAFEAGGADADGDGRLDDAADANGDGLADALVGMTLSLPDTDADGDADYADGDADGDGVPDAIEGHAGTEAAGADTDGDGLDDAYDPDCDDCAGVMGVIAALPNGDDAAGPDFRDVDADGDGILDGVECPMPAMCTDADEDGEPDFRDTDSDDDGLPDADEGHDADFDGTADVAPTGADTDGDGLDDAYDADCMDADDCGGVVGAPATSPDLNSDGRANFRDLDDDGDGRSTAQERADAEDYEGPAAEPSDIDGDGRPNWYDADSDGDGATDMSENAGDEDADGNGLLDYLDPARATLDTDGDGIGDAIECPGVMPPDATCADSDGDGVPDYQDVDDDNDGVLTAVEYGAPDPSDGDIDNDHDADNDGVLNHLDLDADGDGIPDLWENDGRARDSDGDGVVDEPIDADGDGLLAGFDIDDADAMEATTPPPVDSDADGRPDLLDLDADGDGLSDIWETDGADEDMDGRMDDATDTDGDGLADRVDPSDGGTPRMALDVDADGRAAFQDLDTDGDNVPDVLEATDLDSNGVASVGAAGLDMDADGIDDAFDLDSGGTPLMAQDTDGDGTPDVRDTDDDGDRLLTGTIEDIDGDADPTNDDTDRDGLPDYLDPDDDGDTLPTRDEVDESGSTDTDGDGRPDHRDADDDDDGIPTADELGEDGRPIDTDGDGIPDHLDADRIPFPDGGYSGGAFCNAGPARSGLPWLMLLLGWAVRRRRGDAAAE